ncbi:MAG: hypothetical protein KGN02_09130 [bacterium]|nr:hypothetical protein [bacterium]
MLEGTGRTIAHLIEPQHLFVPALVDVFAEAGLFVSYVGAVLDPRRLLDDQPDLVFVDTDFVAEPLDVVRLARVLAPGTQVYVYASAPSDAVLRAFSVAGADRVLEKSSDRREIVQGLREVDRLRRQRRE